MAVTRIGIRLAVSGLVLASIVITAVGVHLLWWRTAEANSHTLAATINEQIVSAVEKELDSITKQARAAHTAISTLFVQHVLDTREADKREFVFSVTATRWWWCPRRPMCNAAALSNARE